MILLEFSSAQQLPLAPLCVGKVPTAQAKNQQKKRQEVLVQLYFYFEKATDTIKNTFEKERIFDYNKKKHSNDTFTTITSAHNTIIFHTLYIY